MRNCSQRVSMFLALVVMAMSAHAARGRETETQLETRTVKIPAGVRYEFSRTVRPGGLMKADAGRAGVLKRTWRVTYRDHKPIAKELVKEERSEPRPALVLLNRSGFETSRGAFRRGKVLTMTATGYYSYVCGTGRTRTGRRATYGVIAVDPHVIPLNSIVYVEGYGMAIAADTGGAIRGHRIDLCYDSKSVADRYGYKRVKVHILRPTR